MESSDPETPLILGQRPARARRRRAVALGIAACACLLVAGVALALRDPGAAEVEAIDRPTPTRPETTQLAPTSHTATSALSPTTLPPTTLPTTTTPPPTSAPPTTQPVPPQMLVLPPPMVQDVAFELDLTLQRFRGELVNVGPDYVEIRSAGGGDATRLNLGDNVRIGLVVAHRPCCVMVTATSTSVLRPGQTYLFGSAAPHQEADGAINPYIGEPIIEIVNAIPPAAYVGMDIEDARRLAIEHQGLEVSECEYSNWPAVDEDEWCASFTVVWPDGIQLEHSKGVVLAARWCC